MPKNKLSQLLCTRQTAAEQLDCSVSKIVRLEREGILHPVRLGRSPTARVYHRVADIERLAEVASDQ